MKSNKKNNFKNKNGFSIIEVILSASILALIVFGIVSAWLYGEHALIKSGDTGRGVAIASEGIEITRNLRDYDFGALSDGTYALKNEGSGWTLVRDEKETIGAYQRYITIASDGISKKNITSTVEWTNVDRTPGIFSSTIVLTNWQQVKNLPKKNTTALEISNVVASPGLGFVIITWTTNKAASSQVEYGGTASWGTSTTETDTSPRVLNHSVQINGLDEGETYHYRVRSEDSSSAVAFSLDDTFEIDVTVDSVAPLITNITSEPSQTSVTIRWNTNEAASSFVNHGLTSGYGATTPEINTISRVTSHVVTFSGLSASTLYHFRVNSYDASGNLGQSSDQTFTTTSTPPVISNVVVQALSVTYVTVSWDTDKLTNAKIVNLDDPFQETLTFDNNPMTNSHELTLSGLEACTEYSNLQLQSYDAGGNFASETLNSITTKGCLPIVLSQFNSSMTDISDIAVYSKVGTGTSFVYALDKTRFQLGVFTVENNEVTREGIIGEQALVNDFGLSNPLVDIFVQDDYLYIADDNHVAIFFIDDRKGEISYMDSFTPGEDVRVYSFSIKTMDIDEKNQHVFFLGTRDEIWVYNMKTFGSIESLKEPSNWEGIGVIDINARTGVNAKDLYVTDYNAVTGSHFLFLVSVDNICMAEIENETIPESTVSCAESTFNQHQQQIAGNSNNGVVVVTGGNSLQQTPATQIELSSTNLLSAKALSKTGQNLDYLFMNTDTQFEEFNMIFAPESETTIGASTTLDVSSYFDGTHYGTGVGASVGYLGKSGKVFFSKLNKILIIDPSL